MNNRTTDDKPYKSADPARKLLAELSIVGGMMEALSEQQSSMPSDKRIENLGKYFVAGYFKPLGGVYERFFDCLGAVGRLDAFDSGVCADIQRYLDGFWPALARYLDDSDMATELHLLVEGLLDLSKRNLAYKEGAEELNRLHDKAVGVFERICQQARKRELSLRYPSQACSDGGGTSHVLKKLDELDDKLGVVIDETHDTNAVVNRMDVRHKRAVAARKASNADDAMERLRKLHPRHYRQVVEVAEILVGKDERGMARTCLSQRRNYSAAAKRLFGKFRKAKKAPPAGGYKSAGSLYSYIHANKTDFFKLLQARAKANGVELPDA